MLALALGADETLENPDKLRGVNPFLDPDVDVDVDTFAIESFESVEGADDKSEKTGGVSGNPVSVSSRKTGDMGENDASCFDISSGD